MLQLNGGRRSMRESQLYPHVETYLNLRFAPSRKPLYGAFLSVPAVTSSAGPAESGQWTRPDLSLVLIWRNKYSPNVNLDLYGFEVKSEPGCDVSAVHEALAQSRHVHYSYVVWHLPTDTRVRPKHQATIADNCRAHGVGLITCSNYENAHDFHIADRCNEIYSEYANSERAG